MNPKLICSKCLIEKPISDFPIRKDSKIGYRKTCKKCKNETHNNWRNRPENVYRSRLSRRNSYYKYRLKEIEANKKRTALHPEWGIKASANYKNKRPYYDALRNVKKQLTKDDIKQIEQVLNGLEKKCYYCGIAENDIHKKTSNYFPVHKLQIDKMIPSLGYTPTNVVLACPICNLIKNRWFSPETMKKIAQEYVVKIWELKADQLL